MNFRQLPLPRNAPPGAVGDISVMRAGDCINIDKAGGGRYRAHGTKRTLVEGAVSAAPAAGSGDGAVKKARRTPRAKPTPVAPPQTSRGLTHLGGDASR
eukprot:4921080-Amphidinium_carterae.1